MELDVAEALRYLGICDADDSLLARIEGIANRLASSLRPRYVYKVFPLTRTEAGFVLTGADLVLPGKSAETMLSDCRAAALLACTLGMRFDAMLRLEEARDMADAVILDACGGAWVEAGCSEAEKELAARLPGSFLTDRFSPGYGDLPLTLQPALCAALNAEKQIGLHVTESLLMNPVKSVTAVIGISDRPQMARIRGCKYCTMRQSCSLRKDGKHCGL